MNNSLLIVEVQKEVDKIIAFLRETYTSAGKKSGVIAVSGGIDSSLSLTLLTKALSPENIFPILLPNGNQSMDDAQSICSFNAIPNANITSINIEPIVHTITETLHSNDSLRQGNIMARARMIALYDLAKQKDALVCGTENKSEHYLGYFTRFGDAASDVEPISYLYKTQVRQLAQFLEIPKSIIEKHPSAGLWENQTDEKELGFSYQDADKILFELIDNKTPEEKLASTGVAPVTIQAILTRVRTQRFKLETPYTL